MSLSKIRGGLDSSVVVRLLTGDPPELTRLALDFLSAAEGAGQQVVVSNLVISEVYFACQHHYKIPKAEVLKGMFDLLSKPIFLIDSTTINLLGSKDMAKAKPGFIDRVIHSEYTNQAVPLITFEKSAGRLELSEVLK